MSSGFVSKQTPLSARGGEEVPARVELEGPSDRPLQIEGDGPEVMMEPLVEADPVKRRQGVAQAMAETGKQYAETTAADMSK